MTKKYGEKLTFFVLEYTDLPENIRKIIKDWCGFHNDCYLRMPSELEPKDLCSDGMIHIENYWKDQKETNNYVGTLEEFIEIYGFKFEVWLINENFDLKNVDKILVHVCW